MLGIPAAAAEHHVSPDGSPTGNGSAAAPWDLETALQHPPEVRPGDTIWIHEGLYRGQFNSHLEGRREAPVTLRSAPGECAVLDGSLTILGAGSTFWGLEIVDSALRRRGSQPGTQPGGTNGKIAIETLAPDIRLINNVIHDNGLGVGFWRPASDSILYGNLIYDNGWIGPDRNHGSGVYTQNREGVKRIEENVFSGNFSQNIQAFGSSTASLSGFAFIGNVIVHGRMLVGGMGPAARITAVANQTFRGNLQLFYRSRENQDLDLRDNHVVGTLAVGAWQQLRIERNTVIDGAAGRLVTMVYAESHDPRAYHWDSNTYHHAAPTGRLFDIDGEGLFGLPNWQARTGFDLEVDHVKALPSEARIVVTPNRYEPGRAHLVAYNWTRSEIVDADVTELGYRAGDKIEIRNALNPTERRVLVYSRGPLRIPMRGWSPSTPRGLDDPLFPSTYPEFGVFLVRRIPPSFRLPVNATAKEQTSQRLACIR